MDRVIQSLQKCRSLKVANVCFPSAATLCLDKEIMVITLVNGRRVVTKGITHDVTIVLGVKNHRETVSTLIQYLQN